MSEVRGKHSTDKKQPEVIKLEKYIMGRSGLHWNCEVWERQR